MRQAPSSSLHLSQQRSSGMADRPSSPAIVNQGEFSHTSNLGPIEVMTVTGLRICGHLNFPQEA
jgi:hypothetical protein